MKDFGHDLSQLGMLSPFVKLDLLLGLAMLPILGTEWSATKFMISMETTPFGFPALGTKHTLGGFCSLDFNGISGT